MPPRKRTTKAAQPSPEDAPKPSKRQKKSENNAQLNETTPAPESETAINEPAVVVNEPAPAATTFPEQTEEAKLEDDKTPKTAETGQNTGEVNDEEENLEEELEVEANSQPQQTSDLYLDTVNRMVLDFDFEKVCSVSLSNINIYGCLVCGKYFRGRSKLTPAFSHSIHDDHHVFINLETAQVSSSRTNPL